MFERYVAWAGCTALLLAAPACRLSSISGTKLDAGADGGFDGGLDAGGNAGPDAGVDAGVDGGGDAGRDAGPDAGRDAGPDAGPDGGLDAGPDAGADAGDSGTTPEPDAGFGLCGPGSELTQSAGYAEPLSVRLIATADMNGDGILDIVEESIDWNTSYFSIRFGLPDGGLGEPETYVFSNLYSVAVGDLNGDGIPDLVASTQSSPSSLVAYLNDGGGRLTAGRPAGVAGFPQAMVIGDVNGDGRGDVVVGDYSPGGSGYPQLEIVLGNSDGGFAQAVAVSQAAVAGFLTGGLAVGDLNGDGLADIVADNPTLQHLIVLLSQADAGFESAEYDPAATGQILLLPNGTATPDLLVGQGDFTSNLGFSVLRNNGDGTFTQPQSFAILGGGQLAIGDFNGDCVLDIATTLGNPNGCQPGWGTSVAYGDGDGGFGNVQFLPAFGSGPYGIAVLGPTSHPDQIVIGDFCDGGLTVYGTSPAP